MALTDQQLLDAIDKAIEGNTEGITGYTVNGRSVTRMTPNQLLRARATILARKQRKAAGGMVQLGRPGRPGGC